MDATPVFFLIAGEASGDLLGARLMRALRKKLDNNVKFTGVGGPQMMAEGLELLFPHTELMHFGVAEVIRHIPRLLRRIREASDAVLQSDPTALITIDAPDFSFRVAKRVKKKAGHTIPLIHYVAPTVWAWRAGRAKKIARFLTHLLAVLPFEPPYFTREGLPCTFVGHSVVEGGASHGSNAVFRGTRNIPHDAPLLTVLPGSRVSETSRLLPVFRETVRNLQKLHPKLQIVVPTVPHLRDVVANEVLNWGVPAYITENEKDKYDGFAASNAALAASGTVALELALAQLPAVIAYKLNALTAFFGRRLMKVRYANLVNIMQDRMLVPEYLQEACTAPNLTRAIDTLLTDERVRQMQISGLAATAAWLGQGEFIPSERAAETVLNAIARGPEEHKPTVLQVLPALVTGGVERGTVETVAALVKNGFRALVASEGGPMVAEVERAGGMHFIMPLKTKNPLTMRANAARLINLIRDQHVDLVHARSRAPAWSAWRASFRCEIPFVTTFHSAYGSANALKRLYNSVMAKSARVIAISNFVGEYAQRLYDVGSDALRIIPRGVDTEYFAAEKVDPIRLDALRTAWRLDPHKPVILMPGRLTRWKGQSLLIEALRKLDTRNFTCVIIGGGKNTPYGKELAAQIGKAGLEERVHIFDTCRDMPAAYLLADITVVPSTRPEGFGRTVIEAQAMGSVAIASDHGGARETVIPGETGFLVTPNNADALSDEIGRVLKTPLSQRRAMGDKAVAHIRANFTTEQMTAKTLAVYRELMQKQD